MCVRAYNINSWTLHLNQFKQLSYGTLEREREVFSLRKKRSTKIQRKKKQFEIIKQESERNKHFVVQKGKRYKREIRCLYAQYFFFFTLLRSLPCKLSCAILMSCEVISGKVFTANMESHNFRAWVTNSH